MKKIVKNKKRVFVGLSGGVDSTVAAALLKRQGYDVAGVFMRFWKDPSTSSGQGENACCSVESEASALAVAQKLGIPFYVFNFEREFKKAVVGYFLRELRAGRTPNPCVVCNPEIKFGLFLDKAKKLGADFISTGHYARIAPESVILSETKNLARMGGISSVTRMRGRSFAIAQDDKGVLFRLFVAKDKQKDQSYFLHRLDQEQLSRVIWPLGGYTKKEVYKLAKKWHLPHQAHQSFDICFAADYDKFLKKHLKLKPGQIKKINNAPHPPLNLRGGEGELLGKHAGLPFYTIGQRASIGGPGPFYVVKKDAKKNILYVSNNERDLYQKKMLVEKVNWVTGRAPKFPVKCKIKIRYGGEAAEAVAKNVIARSTFAWLSINSATKQSRGRGAITGSPRPCGARDDMFVVKFTKPQRAITPGQSAVFYGRRGEVLGGGIIS